MCSTLGFAEGKEVSSYQEECIGEELNQYENNKGRNTDELSTHSQSYKEIRRQNKTTAATNRNDVFSMIKIVDLQSHKDSIIFSKSIVVENLYTDNLKVGIKDDDEKIQWIPLDKVEYFMIDSRKFDRKQWMQADGKMKYIFMELDRSFENETSVYIYYINGNRQYYEESSNGVLKPISNINEYRSNILKNRTGNSNYIQRFRWGITGGVSGSITIVDGLDGSSKNNPSLAGGIWTDLPIGLYGLSAHAEARLFKAFFSLKSQTSQGLLVNEIAYNQAAVSIPISIRYSNIKRQSKLIPYVAAGIDMRYYYNNSLHGVSLVKTHYETWNSKGNTPFNPTIFIGTGLEWKVIDKHSLWLNLEFMPSLMSETFKYKTANVNFDVRASLWTASLSFNL